MSTTWVLRIFLYFTSPRGRPQHLQHSGSCLTILSGVETVCKVLPLWPDCPPLGLPLGLRRDFVRRSSCAAMLSFDGGTLLLLLFFSGLSDEGELPSFSPSCDSSSRTRALELASSVFRLCISTFFWSMMRFRRPISSVFSESDFSSLRRRWHICCKTLSMSLHALTISPAKIGIFCKTGKSGFISLNAESSIRKTVKLALWRE